MTEYICIAGSRACLNEAMVERLIKRLIRVSIEKGDPLPTIVHGGATGVDQIAEFYAEKHGLVRIVFKPAWNGPRKKGAGFQRNAMMAEFADRLVAVWNGRSKGTKHCIEAFRRLGKPVIVKDTDFQIYYEEDKHAKGTVTRRTAST